MNGGGGLARPSSRPPPRPLDLPPPERTGKHFSLLAAIIGSVVIAIISHKHTRHRRGERSSTSREHHQKRLHRNHKPNTLWYLEHGSHHHTSSYICLRHRRFSQVQPCQRVRDSTAPCNQAFVFCRGRPSARRSEKRQCAAAPRARALQGLRQRRRGGASGRARRLLRTCAALA